MRVEPLSRVAAEAELRKRHSKEYDRLVVSKGGPVAALVALVTAHSKEYGQLVTASRERIRAKIRNTEAA